MKLKNIMIATFSSALLLSGCATPNLSYKNEQLNLKVKNEQLQIHGTQLKQERENFSTLFLTQDLLRLDDGSLVMYEYAKTDMDYQFDPTTTRSIDIIFDARSISKVYENSFLFAYQVVLQDNRVLNMIVSQAFDQELIMLYGMSTSKLNSMLRDLDPNAPLAYYKNSIDLSKEPNPLMSRWTTSKVHITPLVIPVRKFGRL